MLRRGMWALLTLLTGVFLALSGYGMRSARSTVSHPNLLSDIVQKRLFGMVLGQPVPSECHRMIGSRSKYLPSLTLRTESASSRVVCYDLLLSTNDTYGIFHRGYVMIERPSCKVIAIGGRFFSGLNQPLVLKKPSPSPDRRKVDILSVRWSKDGGQPWDFTGRLYQEMLVDLFDVVATSRVELRSTCWDSGDLHQTKFTVSDDLIIDLNFHQQFGEELVIHGANLSTVRECDLCNYKEAKSGSMGFLFGRHPAERLYDELKSRKSRPRVLPDSFRDRGDCPPLKLL